MTLGVVGLGLIGGSFVKAYHEAGHRVLTWNRSPTILDYAILSGEADGRLDRDTAKDCDLILLCLSAVAAAAEDYYLWYDITQVKKYGNVDQGIGFYLLAAGAALIFVAGIYGMMKEKKKLEQYTTDYMNSI